MEQFTRHYFRMVFHLNFLNAHGDDFQRFFGSIMNLRYPGDFTQTRPWGKLGDNKCDGYLPSQRKFYQCYAPDDLSQKQTLAKLNKDFTGALAFQKMYFDTWVFVHNARDRRLPSWLTFQLEHLRQSYLQITIETLGLYELLQEALNLSENKLVDLFGTLLTLQDVLAVQFKDVRPILDLVAHYEPYKDTPPRPVSPQKLQRNQLNEDVQQYLRHGMIKADVVRKYLDQNPDKELASRVTLAFRQKYEALKKEQLEPDNIFYGLRLFAQGQFSQTPRTEGAVLAVLAYLFEECDIFENTSDG